jgi:hypothetical protein
MQEIDEQFQKWELVVDEWRDAGEVIVALGYNRLRGKGSGVAFDQPMGWLVEVADGMLFRLQTFPRPKEALEAVGLRE